MVVSIVLSACVLANILTTYTLLLYIDRLLSPQPKEQLKHKVSKLRRGLIVIMFINFAILGVAVYLNDIMFV